MKTYSAKIIKRAATKGQWPAISGQILENGVVIGTFKRAAVKNNFVPPIETTFRTDGAKSRFYDFADCLSIAETVEALI